MPLEKWISFKELAHVIVSLAELMSQSGAGGHPGRRIPCFLGKLHLFFFFFFFETPSFHWMIMHIMEGNLLYSESTNLNTNHS